MNQRWAEFSDRLVNSAIKNRIPISGAFELTARCNFKCKMCYVCYPPNDKKIMQSELSAEEWISLAREARDAGLLFLTLTGGEVFIRKDFQKIYEALSEMGFNLTIYTNASLITSEKARWLGSIPPSLVSVTVYGATPETCEKVTGCADAYNRTLRGLDALKSEGVKVAIKTTVVQANYKEFDQLTKLAEKFGVGLGIVNYISPRREGDCSDPLGNRLLPEVIAGYEKQAMEHNMKVNPNKKRQMQDIPEGNPVSSDTAFRCQAGRCGFWISWKGHMTPCGLLDIPYTKPLKSGFQSAWAELQKECASVPECSECMQCSMRDNCMTCPARLMAETGAFDKPASYLCETAKNRIALGFNQDRSIGIT